MVILIGGASHTGKTVLAQNLIGKYGCACLSMDLLKMGLIRSGRTSLTPEDDEALTDYLWPIVREIVKTAVENEQSLIVEGAYIPFHWRKDFEKTYLKEIRCLFLAMSGRYIREHFGDIRAHACDAEQRQDGRINAEELVQDNEAILAGCRAHGCPHILIDETYPAEFPL